MAAAAITVAEDTMAVAIMAEVEGTTEEATTEADIMAAVTTAGAAISMAVMATTGIIRTAAVSGTAPGTRTA
jgi:hypothetical protein